MTESATATAPMPPAAPMSLGELRRAGRGIFISCRSCGHERTVDARAETLAHLPDAIPVSQLALKMRCRHCSERERIYTMPAPLPGEVA